MTKEDIINLRDRAETGSVQFKERINSKSEIGEEMVAYSNSKGGLLIIGINDKTGYVNALSFKETQETTNLLSNFASENVVPSIVIDTESVAVDGGNIVVAKIKEGNNKPYHDNKGVVWIKNGTDKRKVFDNSELAEMMTECGTFDPDRAAVPNATINDLDEQTIKLFLSNRFSLILSKKGMVGDKLRESSLDEVAASIASNHTIEHLLRNLGFIRADGQMTVAAILLFAKYTQRWLPVMTAKCISFAGNSIGSTTYRDQVKAELMEGNLLHQFEVIMSFFTRNLRNIQVEENFNTPGQLEIPYESLLEFVVNALVHRSLNWGAPIRIFIFDNRVEIHSPGTLPNGLKIDDIVLGTSLPRNRFLFDNAIHLLPYTGAGSGMQRALSCDINVEFKNDERMHEFLITIHRPDNSSADGKSNQVTIKSNQEKEESNQVGGESNQVGGESNQVGGKSNQVGDESNHVCDRLKSSDVPINVTLTKKQEDIRIFCSVPRTAQDIMDRLGITNQSKNRQKHIGTLIEMGILEMTNPENPKASNQKYRSKPKKL